MIQRIKKTKDENHVIITTDAVKASDKILHSFIIKTLSNMDIEGTYLNIIKAMYACLVSLVMSDTVQLHALEPPRLLCPWDSPGKNIGVGYHASSRGSSQPRDQTQVSHIAGRFCTDSHQGSPVTTYYLPYVY